MSRAGMEPLMERVEGGEVIGTGIALFYLGSLLLRSYRLPHQQFATSCQQSFTFTSGQCSPSHGPT